MKRRGIQEWMRGHGALVRAFAHRTAIVEHGERLLSPRAPGAPAAPPMPPVYRARAALLAPPHAPGQELPPVPSSGGASDTEGMFADEVAMGVPESPDRATDVLAQSEAAPVPIPALATPNDNEATGATGTAESSPRPSPALPTAVPRAGDTMFVPPRATLPSSDAPSEIAKAAESATLPTESVLGETEGPSPALAADDSDARRSAPEFAAGGVEPSSPAAATGALFTAISEMAAGAPGDAGAGASREPMVSDAAGSSVARESAPAGPSRYETIEESISESAAGSLGVPPRDAATPPSSETPPSGTFTASVQPSAPNGANDESIAHNAAESRASATGGDASSAGSAIPEGAASAKPPELSTAAISPEAALGKDTADATSSVKESAETTVTDPYVANILAVLRGEANQPSPGELPSPPSAASETSPTLSRADEPTGPERVGARASAAPSVPNEPARSPTAAPSAPPTAPAASASAIPVAAASKERDLTETSGSPITSGPSASAAPETKPAESLIAPLEDVGAQSVERAAAASLDAPSTPSTSAPMDIEPSPFASEVESATGAGNVDLASGSASASPAREPEPTPRADAPDGRREALNAEDDLLRRTGDPVRDAAVREVRRARPLSPELAKRLAEARSSSEATPSPPKSAEPPSATTSAPPNEGDAASDPAPVNPMLWLERLREAAKIEAAGGREKYREAQARAASEPPHAAPTPVNSPLGVRSAATPSAVKPSPTPTARPDARGASGQGARDSATSAPGGAAASSAPSAPPVAAAARGRNFVPPAASSAGPSVQQPRAGASSSKGQESAPRLDEDLAQAIDATPPSSLGEPARAFLRPLLGIDPASVPVHEGVDAGAAADARNADALAVGERILAPPAATTGNSPESLGLLAHELTHVARQRTPSFVPPLLREEGAQSGAFPGEMPGVPNVPFAPASSTAGEEDIALATERAVRRAAREEQPGGADGGGSAVARTFPTAPVWNAGERPTESRELFDEIAEQDTFGGFPAPNEPLSLPSSWQKPAPPVGVSSRQRHAGSARGESLGADGPSSADGDSSPVAVQTAQTGRVLEHEDAHASHGGDKKSGGHEDGEQIDRLAAQVYQVLRRRLIAERRRGS